MKSDFFTSKKSIVIYALIFAGLSFTVWNSTFADEIRERAIAPLEFQLRQALKKDPEISQRLKVVVYGDKAKREFGAQELITIKQWTNFIDALASRRPRAIIFDKFFGTVIGSEADIAAFNSLLKTLETPVIAGAAYGGLNDPKNEVNLPQLSTWNIESPQDVPQGDIGTLVGPIDSIRSSFRKLGSIRFSDGKNVEPAWLDSNSGAILPHLSLSFLTHVRWNENRIFSDDWQLFLNKKGLIPVNFVPRENAFTQFLPAAQILRLGQSSPSLQKINPGDVVLVLPSMYAGSTDFKKSPLGRIEGGFYHVGVINGTSLLSLRSIHKERQSERIEMALAGMVSPQVLNKIKKNPESFYQRPNQVQLTVMFIDIEGFSLRTSHQLPADVFTVLHAQIERMSNIVHAHGGIVDRILGDGMLCYFGHSFADSQTQRSALSDHAYQALRCAIEIQQFAAHLTAEANNNPSDLSFLLPLRIGLNTGDVFLGNLGTGSRIDLTIVGNHVNLAKRLEDACETFKIMLSDETFIELEKGAFISKCADVRFEKRFLTVKHQDDLISGWECDPHVMDQSQVDKANRKLAKIRPEFADNISNIFTNANSVRVNADLRAQIALFQERYFALRTTSYYCRKVNLAVALPVKANNSSEQNQNSEHIVVHMQVIAGKPLGDLTYVHILKPMHMTVQQVNDLLENSQKGP